MSNTIRLSVKGVIFYNDRFLLVQKIPHGKNNDCFWELPGGGIGFGESPAEALAREIKEETGISVTVSHPLFVWSFMKKTDTQVIGITYHCIADDTTVQLSPEHLSYQWVTPEETEQVNLLPELKEDLIKWNWNKEKLSL